MKFKKIIVLFMVSFSLVFASCFSVNATSNSLKELYSDLGDLLVHSANLLSSDPIEKASSNMPKLSFSIGKNCFDTKANFVVYCAIRHAFLDSDLCYFKDTFISKVATNLVERLKPSDKIDLVPNISKDLGEYNDNCEKIKKHLFDQKSFKITEEEFNNYKEEYIKLLEFKNLYEKKSWEIFKNVNEFYSKIEDGDLEDKDLEKKWDKDLSDLAKVNKKIFNELKNEKLKKNDDFSRIFNNFVDECIESYGIFENKDILEFSGYELALEGIMNVIKEKGDIAELAVFQRDKEGFDVIKKRQILYMKNKIELHKSVVQKIAFNEINDFLVKLKFKELKTDDSEKFEDSKTKDYLNDCEIL